MRPGDRRSQETVIVREEIAAPEIHVFDYVRVILKYRRMILVICGVMAVAVGVCCLLRPATYTATASIVPPMDSPESGLGLLSGGESAVLRKIMNVGNPADIYVGLLESRVVADRLLEQFDLMRAYDVRSSYYARKKLRRNTRIDVGKDGIVSIRVRDRDRTRSAGIANAYVEELDRQNGKLSSGQAASKRMFLENRLREIEEKLSQIDNIPSRDAMVQETLYDLLIREYEIAKIEEAKSIPTIQVLDVAIPPELRDPRGTVSATAVAIVASLVLGILLAFGRESFACDRVDEDEAPALEDESRASERSLSHEHVMESPTGMTSGRICVRRPGGPAVPSKPDVVVQLD